MKRVTIGSALACLSLALIVAGCSTSLTPIESLVVSPSGSASGTSSSSPSASPSATGTGAAACGDPVASYAPLAALPAPSALPAGSYEAQIKARGRLVVGVSADTLLFGYRNSITGELEGFDIDMVRAVAKAIFGDPSKVEFKVITAAQRIPLLSTPVDKGGVDLVARTMTVNCARWAQVAFSSVYFLAHQKVLVPLGSPAKGLGDLVGKKVCAPKGSTSIDTLARFPGVVPVAAAAHTDCLALFQQGSVDAITGDDAVLAGFVAQDPYARVIGPAVTDEPYGLAIAKEHVDFVRFVNSVLEVERTGAWQRSYDTWLAAALGAGTGAPKPVYGRVP